MYQKSIHLFRECLKSSGLCKFSSWIYKAMVNCL